METMFFSLIFPKPMDFYNEFVLNTSKIKKRTERQVGRFNCLTFFKKLKDF
jgi:hypothetical protein